MSEHWDRVMRACLQVPCLKCGAKIGEPCKTVGGGYPTVMPHTKRFRIGVARVRAGEDLTPPKENQ